MAAEKIAITDRLRLDIIECRKAKGISSYDLSERVGNGHSKFWLQNIESGKTKKITKDDLISIYMILEDTDNPDEVIYDIERILNQPIGDNIRHWYDLIDISEDYAEIYDDEKLMDILDEFLEDEIIPKIRNRIFGMSVNQKQAALTALQHLNYSFYKNSDLAFALIAIPVYGVKNLDKTDNTNAMNDLLSLYAKFNDLVIKNNSMATIRRWEELDKEMHKEGVRIINTALENFKIFLNDFYDTISNPNLDVHKLDMHGLIRQFNKYISFLIEEGQPNVLKHYLKSFRIHTGPEFATHIENCIKWFIGFQGEFSLPYIYDVIDKEKLSKIYKFLNNYGEVTELYIIGKHADKPSEE